MVVVVLLGVVIEERRLVWLLWSPVVVVAEVEAAPLISRPAPPRAERGA
jgi:hypothetical protein